MTLRSDPKPVKRIRDKDVLKAFVRDQECIGCGHGRGVEAHHILRRSQGGDDVPGNLVALCNGCHGAIHGRPYRAYGFKITQGFVESAIARYIGSEAGDDARWYLTGKLGPEASVLFLEKLGVDE